jgi:hypothetical protein
MNEIINYNCPNLVILSSSSSHSSHLCINNNKISDDSATISDDDKNKNVTIMTISDESDDRLENKDKKEPCEGCGKLTENMIKETFICEKCAKTIPEELK